MIFYVLIRQETEQHTRLADQMGVPLTRDEWMELRTKVDAYFATNPDDQIAQEIASFRDRYLNPDSNRESIQPEKPKPKSGHVYLIQAEGTPWYKIGRSRTPVSRAKSINSQSPFPCKVLRTIAVSDAASVEKTLHAIFADRRAEGEWFALTSADVDWLMKTSATTTEEFSAEVVNL